MKKLIFLLLSIVISTGAFAKKHYIDPENGDISNNGSKNSPWPALSEVVNSTLIASKKYAPIPYTAGVSILIDKNPNGKIQPGDTLILMSGLHGKIEFENFVSIKPITIMGMEGEEPILKEVKLKGCRGLNFENLTVSPEPYGGYLNRVRLFSIESNPMFGANSKHINADNITVYSTKTPWTTANEWVKNVSEGVYLQADSSSITNSLIKNISMGITAAGKYLLVENNKVFNFSGDGIRILSSYIDVMYNFIKNNYNVDDNHDDGIQSWKGGNGKVDNNKVIGNIIINTDDNSRPLNGSMQGLGFFDGFFNNWLVANNVVYTNHYHGITFLGARNCKIINNTVLDPSPQRKPGGAWIQVGNHKSGSPSSGCVIANNVANSFKISGSTGKNNLIVNSHTGYKRYFVDYANFNFYPAEGSPLINVGASSYAMEFDIDSVSRSAYGKPDIGAYEYNNVTSSIKFQKKERMVVSPNPFQNNIQIKNASTSLMLQLYSLDGKHLFKGSISELNTYIGNLNKGIYLLEMYDSTKKILRTEKIIKH